MDDVDIDAMFDYYVPSVEKTQKYRAIRISAKGLALVIFQHTPPGETRDIAVRKVQEAMLIANAAIAAGPASGPASVAVPAAATAAASASPQEVKL